MSERGLAGSSSPTRWSKENIMKKTKYSRWVGGIWILVLLGVCALGGELAYLLQRQIRINSRPLVLIHNPVNHEQIKLGDGISIHATARSKRGVTRMELWINDRLFATQPAGKEGVRSPFILNKLWQPTTSGPQVVQVRAISANGIEGLATITVEISETANDISDTHTVREGETFASVAEQHGLTPNELSALNPGSSPGETAPGDELHLPSDEGADGGSPPIPEAPASDSTEPPEADGPEPGSFFEWGAPFGFFLPGLPRPLSDDPVRLKLEMLSLETSQAYDTLHCYIGVGGNSPQWYPDRDHDQSTDESFVPTDDGWNVADYFSGAAAPIFTGTGNQPLPFSLECVGVLGGTEAAPAGNLELSIPPDAWGGITRTASSTGEGASFQIEYRITNADSAPHGFPIELDPSMAPPSHLWLDEQASTLHWDYTPNPEELLINGFRIYLNETLQWSVGSAARQTELPPEWLRPPCGDEYVLSVSAYKGWGVADVHESMLASPPITIVTPPDECQRQIEINFISFRTFDLPSDGRYEDRSNDLGPVYGDFSANEQMFSIDTRPSVGISHNSLYNFDEVTEHGWRLSGSPIMRVEVEPDGTFQYGFSIMDEDTGRCDGSHTSGCDDLVCEGWSDPRRSGLDDDHEETLHSTNGRCELTVRFGPTDEGVIGSAGDRPALPFLEVENYRIDDTTGTIHFDIVNTGRGTWPTHNLDIWLVDSDDQNHARDDWYVTNFRLEPGQVWSVERDIDLNQPQPCIVLDPENQTTEEAEWWSETYRPFCMRLPDLTIVGVSYEETNAQLVVNLQNFGSGSLNRTVNLAILRGSNHIITSVDVPYAETGLLVPIPITPEQREEIVGGYSIVADYPNHITEEDEDNNEYQVEGRQQYWVTWHWGRSNAFVRGLINDMHMSLTGTVSGNQIFAWSAPELTLYLGIFSESGTVHWGSVGSDPPPFQSDLFYLAGDERLTIVAHNSVNAGAEHYDLLRASYYIPTSDYDAFNDYTFPECDAQHGDPGYYYLDADYSGEDDGRPDPGVWSTLFKVCRYTQD
jgi:LysM repeat protein